ncbi:class I SAM-dependent methyltransferase [Thiosocius teredinicola]|uniref:class I SAM-dependent methyltransferase n=1 Tax=Thiosocius teredinicola TaxID=1973002 RepID=UPI00099143E8
MGSRKVHSIFERGFVPDAVMRAGIRRLLQQRLDDIGAHDIEQAADREQVFLQTMRSGNIAESTDKANQQHYELPPAFFQQVLGTHRKYSCAYWGDDTQTLDDAEAAALQITCDRAGLQNGQRILELGCGWGSLSLFMAQRFPDSRITAVSNSHSQRAAIVAEAEARDIHNLEVITADMNVFQPEGAFDRVVSVEMFEHMRNWERLLNRVTGWLAPDGHFFMHIFVHRTTPYLFLDQGPSDWMSRHFFSGGMMPSADLPLLCDGRLRLERRWFWSGKHYSRTCEAWLHNMDGKRRELQPLFVSTYGRDFADVWWQRWRIFFLACSELFAFNQGQEWLVGHYLFVKRDANEG